MNGLMNSTVETRRANQSGGRHPMSAQVQCPVRLSSSPGTSRDDTIIAAGLMDGSLCRIIRAGTLGIIYYSNAKYG
jgi:hypothetical protein